MYISQLLDKVCLNIYSSYFTQEIFMQEINSTHLRKNVSEILDSVFFERETIIITKGVRKVAKIVPIERERGKNAKKKSA